MHVYAFYHSLGNFLIYPGSQITTLMEKWMSSNLRQANMNMGWSICNLKWIYSCIMTTTKPEKTSVLKIILEKWKNIIIVIIIITTITANIKNRKIEKACPYLVTCATNSHKNALWWKNIREATSIEISVISTRHGTVTHVNWKLEALAAK